MYQLICLILSQCEDRFGCIYSVYLCCCALQTDRRYQSRLQDVKDRLEQSDSTNRSLQNYVQFLKASYASVFGDSALTSSFRPPSPL